MARTYELTEKGRAMQFTGQQGVIHQALHDGPRSVSQIAEVVKPNLQTRQTPTKVVAFYMSTWRGLDYVRVVSDDGPSEPPAAKTANAPVSSENVSQPTEPAAIESLPVVEANPTKEPPTQRDGEPLGVFVVRLIQDHGVKWPIDVEHLTNGLVGKKQAQDAMLKLKGKGVLVKTDDGYVLASQAVVSE